jgi:threonine/homoserine/homoserine lactone efflux protein
MQDIASFVLAAVALTGSPGPATLGLAAAGAAFGLRHSLGLVIGILVGVQVVMLATGSGIAGLVLTHPRVGPIVSVLAAAYMLYLAYRIATAPPPAAASPTARPPGIVPGLFLGFGNPKASAAMAALSSGFVLVPQRPLADLAAKMASLLLIMIVVCTAWLMAGSMLARAFRHPKLARAINIAFAVLLLASVAFTL